MSKHTQVFGPDNEKQVDDVLVFDKIADGVRGIRLGESRDVVLHEWGPPNSIEEKGSETIFIYKHDNRSVEVIFLDKKVTETLAGSQ